MYVLQLFQMQYFAFFAIANLPEFVLNLQGWSGDNLRFLILRLPILVELALGFFLFFLFIYLFTFFYRNDSNKSFDHKFRCTTIVEL